MRWPRLMCSANSLGSLIIIFCVILSGECRAYSTPANVASVYIHPQTIRSLDANVGQCTWYVYGRSGNWSYNLSKNSQATLNTAGVPIFRHGGDTWYSDAISPGAIAAGITTGPAELGAIMLIGTQAKQTRSFVEKHPTTGDRIQLNANAGLSKSLSMATVG